MVGLESVSIKTLGEVEDMMEHLAKISLINGGETL